MIENGLHQFDAIVQFLNQRGADCGSEKRLAFSVTPSGQGACGHEGQNTNDNRLYQVEENFVQHPSVQISFVSSAAYKDGLRNMLQRPIITSQQKSKCAGAAERAMARVRLVPIFAWTQDADSYSLDGNC